jgi:anti-sigma factor RsiW
MSCLEIERKILDYQENRLPAAQRQEVEAHLSGCSECRQFARQLQELDAALSLGIKSPALSTDFDRRLRQKIQALPTEAQRTERRRQLQIEFDAGMARLRRGVFELGNLLDHLGWPVTAALGAWLVWRITPQVTARLHLRSLGDVDPNLVPWLVAGAVLAAVALAKAFPRHRSRFLVW